MTILSRFLMILVAVLTMTACNTEPTKEDVKENLMEVFSEIKNHDRRNLRLIIDDARYAMQKHGITYQDLGFDQGVIDAYYLDSCIFVAERHLYLAKIDNINTFEHHLQDMRLSLGRCGLGLLAVGYSYDSISEFKEDRYRDEAAKEGAELLKSQSEEERADTKRYIEALLAKADALKKWREQTPGDNLKSAMLY